MAPRFVTGKLVDAATVSASSESAHLPASNLLDRERAKVWRSAQEEWTTLGGDPITTQGGEPITTQALGGQWVRYDFGAPKTINCLVAVNHNLTAKGKFIIKAGNAAGDSSLLEETHRAWEPLFSINQVEFSEHGMGGYLSDEERAIYYPAGSFRWIDLDAGKVRARHWEIGFDDPSNPAGFIEASRLILEAYRQSSRRVSRGLINQPVDPSIVTYTPMGNVLTDRRTKYRRALANLSRTPGSETWALWYAMFQEVGVGRHFAVDLLPEATNLGMRLHNQMYCHFSQGGIPQISVPLLDKGAFALELRESV